MNYPKPKFKVGEGVKSLNKKGCDWRNNPEKLYQCGLAWLDSLIVEFSE